MSIQGKLKEVSVIVTGSELDQDSAAGASILYLSSVDDFDENGGSVSIGGGTPVTYLTVNEAEDFTLDAEGTQNPPICTMTLTTPEVGAHLTGDRIDLYPHSEEKVARVMLTGNADEPVECRIPDYLVPLLIDGIRTEGVEESVIVDQDTTGDYYIAQVLGGQTQVLSNYLDTVPQPTSDGLPPGQVTGVEALGGIRSVFLKWPGIANYDLVTYSVYACTTAGFTKDATTLIGTAAAGQFVAREAYDITGAAKVDLVGDTTYYFAVQAVDEDGPGLVSAEIPGTPAQVTGPDIANNSVITDHLVANSITADKFSAVLAMVSQLLVGDNITINPSGPDNGIRIALANGGHIWMPADGSDADFNRVKARFTEAVVEDELSILGANNRVGGAMTLDASIPPPAVAPVLSSISDDSPLSLSIVDSNFFGLGEDGTNWIIARTTSSNPDGDFHSTTVTVYNVNKTTGVVSTRWTKKIQTETFPGSAIQLISFHANATHAAFLWLVPAGQKFDLSGYLVDDPAHFVIQVRDIVTGNQVSISTGMEEFRWSTQSLWYNPAIFTNGTNVWVGASLKSTQKVSVYQYNIDMTGGTLVMTSAVAFGAVSFNSMYVGNADFGSSRYILTSIGSIYVFNGTARSASEEWAASGGEQIKGLNYIGGRFVSLHTTSKIREYSTLVASTSRTAKYTWFNSTFSTESSDSPGATFTQVLRQWLKVSTSAIPNSVDPQSPDSVRVYIANQRQASVPPFSTSVTYEAPATGGPNSPGVDGFAALGITGSIKSETEESAGVPKIWLKGDGKYRLGDQVDGAWTKYTPTLTGSGTTTLGNGTHECRYKYIADKAILVEGTIIFGSTTSMGTAVAAYIGLPVAPYINPTGVAMSYVGSCILLDASASTAGYRAGSAFIFDVNGVTLLIHETTTGKFAGNGTPWAWTTGDILRWSIIYEVV